eukprot:CAMPEP_0180820012 /NCGR_PEP_ID=MMETSP1038_2-20121128/70049_1 /TAXON_ID=632150 /ORGANISM="Azadinium spinosum, Strain 3D9" /LENGTH=183 /DNA_ID=CAMNT_0022862057 /DNA_START=1 /DNA_END=549 /DNA_ORIENTATION=+
MLNWLFRPKPHIVKILEVIVTPGSYYQIMEKLEVFSLQDLLDSGERLSFDDTVQYFHQMLLAVRELHKARLIHRDIKPDNFCFDSLGNLKLVDVCGMLRHLSTSDEGYGISSQDEKTAVCGTLAYMSPEALLGRGRQAADMWAVGVALHQMLAGTLPFEASSIEEAKEAHGRRVNTTKGDWED